MDACILKIKKAINSRTVWILVIMYLVNIQPQIHQFIPVESIPYIDAFLTVLAGYFHMSPSQNYGQSVLATENTVITPPDTTDQIAG